MSHEIAPANESTMAEVEAWLDLEERAYQVAQAEWEEAGYEGDQPRRGFRCNWDSVKRSWREGYAPVDVLIVDGEAVGFLDGTDIVEVRPDLRGRRYGRLLAQFMIDRAWEEGLSVLEIEIAPASAEPFWKHMGFTVVPDRRGPGGGTYAYQVLHRSFDLAGGERVPFTIGFYTAEERYGDDPTPFARYSGQGERLTDGSVQLPERAYCHHPRHSQWQDYFVKIEVGGETLLFDKAKYDASKALGMRRDPGYTYFIERVIPSARRD